MKIPKQLHALGDSVLDLAAKAALAAARVIAAAVNDDLRVEQKGVADFVTHVDHDAEAVILQALADGGVAPESIISEESSLASDRVRDGWLVDPLDGTSALLFRSAPQHPSTILTCLKDGELYATVVLFPLTGEWFYALRDRGAYRNEKRLQLDAPVRSLSNAWVALNRFGDGARQSAGMTNLDQRLRSADGAAMVTCEVPHSGIGCRVATGTAAAVVHDNAEDDVKQCPWDMAPQLLIVREAGGVALALDGSPIGPFHAVPYLVAQSRDLADELLRLAK